MTENKLKLWPFIEAKKKFTIDLVISNYLKKINELGYKVT